MTKKSLSEIFFNSTSKRTVAIIVTSLIFTFLFFRHVDNITRQKYTLGKEDETTKMQESKSVSFENLSRDLAFIQTPVSFLKFNIYTKNNVLLRGSNGEIRPFLNMEVSLFSTLLYSPEIKFKETREIFNRTISMTEIPYLSFLRSFKYDAEGLPRLDKSNNSFTIFFYPTIGSIIIILIIMIFFSYGLLISFYSLLKFLKTGYPVFKNFK